MPFPESWSPDNLFLHKADSDSAAPAAQIAFDPQQHRGISRIENFFELDSDYPWQTNGTSLGFTEDALQRHGHKNLAIKTFNLFLVSRNSTRPKRARGKDGSTRRRSLAEWTTKEQDWNDTTKQNAAARLDLARSSTIVQAANHTPSQRQNLVSRTTLRWRAAHHLPHTSQVARVPAQRILEDDNREIAHSNQN